MVTGMEAGTTRNMNRNWVTIMMPIASLGSIPFR